LTWRADVIYGVLMSAGIEGRSQSARTESPAGESPWGYYLVAALAAVMGLIFLNDFRRALDAQRNWTPASGRVTESKVVRYHSRRSTSYSTYVSYSYAAGDALYGAGPLEVNKYKLYFSEGGAEEDMQDNFPQGKSLDVYYNPSNPSESSLGLPGAPGLAVPIVFFLLSAGLVSLALHSR